jgi:hypothetical protein
VVADGSYYAGLVAGIASQAVQSVMLAGQSKHGNSWIGRPDSEDLAHAKDHMSKLLSGNGSQDDITHCLTRLALILTRRKEGSTMKGITS